MQVWSAPPSKTPEQDFWEREKQKDFFLFLFFLCLFVMDENQTWGRCLAGHNESEMEHRTILGHWLSAPWLVVQPYRGEWPGMTVFGAGPTPVLALWLAMSEPAAVSPLATAPSMGSAGTSSWSLADSRDRVNDHTVIRGSAFSQAPLCGAIVNFNQILGS